MAARPRHGAVRVDYPPPGCAHPASGYRIASATCPAAIVSEPARSAIVRATFRIRLHPRAESPSRVNACSSRRSDAQRTSRFRLPLT